MSDITVQHYGCDVGIHRPDNTELFQGEIVGVQDNSGVLRITVRITLERRQMSYHYVRNPGSTNEWTRIHAHGVEQYVSEGHYKICLKITEDAL